MIKKFAFAAIAALGAYVFLEDYAPFLKGEPVIKLLMSLSIFVVILAVMRVIYEIKLLREEAIYRKRRSELITSNFGTQMFYKLYFSDEEYIYELIKEDRCSMLRKSIIFSSKE